jgi:hypothetical protein
VGRIVARVAHDEELEVEERAEYEQGAQVQQAVSTPSTHARDVLTGVKVQAGYVHAEEQVSEKVDKTTADGRTVRNIPHYVLGADPDPDPTPDDARWVEVDVPNLFPDPKTEELHECKCEVIAETVQR